MVITERGCNARNGGELHNLWRWMTMTVVVYGEGHHRDRAAGVVRRGKVRM